MQRKNKNGSLECAWQVRKGVPELTVLVLELVSEVSAAKKVGKQGIACCVMQCTLLG